MSNTRYASEGSEVAQERYLSSPEYVEQRGIAGNTVAAKAELMISDAVRSLLFFLQGMSIRPKGGGLKQLAAEIVEAFPERIGTPTMHKAGIAIGRSYGPKVSKQIECELGIRSYSASILAEMLGEEIPDEEPAQPMSVDQAVQACREALLTELPDLLLRLCIDPKMRVPMPGRNVASDSINEIQDEDLMSRCGALDTLYHTCFADIMGALYQFQANVQKKSLGEVAKTAIAQKIWRNLDHCLATGKIAVLEGETRIGKTTPAEAWCKAHLGEARFVSLVGVTSKTSFFRQIARALGIASGLGRSSTDTQSRDEDMLHRSRIMLVIDEAQNAWPQGKRIYSRPELIDWINTALFNHNVPVALIATPQFSERLHCAETQTSWRADQLRGRIGRYVKFPAKPSGNDVEMVVRHLLPKACPATVDAIVGYAYRMRIPLSAAENVIDEARLIARENGRPEIRLKDVFDALRSVVVESDAAKAASINPKPSRVALKEPCNTLAEAAPSRANPEVNFPNVPRADRRKDSLATLSV